MFLLHKILHMHIKHNMLMFMFGLHFYTENQNKRQEKKTYSKQNKAQKNLRKHFTFNRSSSSSSGTNEHNKDSAS